MCREVSRSNASTLHNLLTHSLAFTASFVPLYAIFALFFGGLWSLMYAARLDY